MIDPIKYTALGALTIVTMPIWLTILAAFGLAASMHRLGGEVASQWRQYREERVSRRMGPTQLPPGERRKKQ